MPLRTLIFSIDALVDFCERKVGETCRLVVNEDGEEFVETKSNNKYSMDEICKMIEQEYNCKVVKFDFAEVNCKLVEDEECFIFVIE